MSESYRHVSKLVGGLCLLTLGACGEAVRLSTEWPASDDDVVFVVRAQASGGGRIEGAYVGRPTLNLELTAEEGTFLVVVRAQRLLGLHPAIDLRPEGLGGATPAEDVKAQCTSQVRVSDQTINVRLPQPEVFELNREASRFLPSDTSIVALLGTERMQFELREEPCRASQSPARFEIDGDLLSPMDPSVGVNDIARVGDTVFLLSAFRVYVLRRHQPSLSFALPAGAMNRYYARRFAIEEQPSGEIAIVVAMSAIQSNVAGLFWYRWDGDALDLQGRIDLPHAVYELAVSPDGTFVTGGAVTPVMTVGTMTSTVVETVDLPLLESVTNVAFSDAGELAIVSESNLIRTRVGRLDNARLTRLLTHGGVPIDSRIRGLHWIGETVYVLAPEEGLLVAPPRSQSGHPIEVGVISSDSDCGVLTECSGYNRVDEGFEGVRANFAQTMLFYTTDRCPIMAGYVPETGCATEVAVKTIAGRLFADERWLTFSSGFEVFEIPASAFSNQ